MNIATAELPLEDSVKVKFTTSDVESMLWNKYSEKGEYVVIFDVPDMVGLKQTRRCDAVAIGMWGSTGRLIHGFEVKASRSDWLREVKAVDKADPFIERCDKWWLVTADVSIAKSEEIPEAWGWMTATGTGLRIQRPARQLPQDPQKMDRLWAFALIRRASERGNQNSPEWQAAYRKLEDQKRNEIKAELDRRQSGAPGELVKLQERVKAFECASGMRLEDWRLGNVGRLARAINELADDGYRGYHKQLQSQRKSLESLLKAHDEILTALASPAAIPGDDECL